MCRLFIGRGHVPIAGGNPALDDSIEKCSLNDTLFVTATWCLSRPLPICTSGQAVPPWRADNLWLINFLSYQTAAPIAAAMGLQMLHDSPSGILLKSLAGSRHIETTRTLSLAMFITLHHLVLLATIW